MNKTNSTIAKPKSELKVPTDFTQALAASPKAKAQWDDLTLISRMDFIRWITSAKQAETRRRRITVACSKLEAGQRRPCCYAVVPMEFYKALAADPKAKAQWSSLTPVGRREVAAWIDSVPTPAKKLRIQEACALLAAGKQPS